MKKFLFFVMAAFVCSTMGAQVVTTTSFKKAKGETVWYLKAGMNLSTMDYGEGENPGSKVGYNVGIAFDRAMGSNGLFWNSGLLLATKGWKEGDYSFTTHKLEIPLTLGYKYGVNDDIAIDFRAGGFANYDLFGKVDDGEESVNIGDLEEYDRFSAGLQFGLGAWYQKLNFNITYQMGLIDQNEAKERNWMISIGYAF